MSVGAEVITSTGDGGDYPVVGRDDVAAGRIVDPWHLLRGNHAIPLELPGPAGNWQPAVDGGPARDHRPHQVADVPAGISSHQVVIDQSPAAHGLEERIAGAGPKHREQAVKGPIQVEK